MVVKSYHKAAVLASFFETSTAAFFSDFFQRLFLQPLFILCFVVAGVFIWYNI